MKRKSQGCCKSSCQPAFPQHIQLEENAWPRVQARNKEKDLLITLPISSDGDKQMQEGEDAVARTGKWDSFFSPCS